MSSKTGSNFPESRQVFIASFQQKLNDFSRTFTNILSLKIFDFFPCSNNIKDDKESWAKFASTPPLTVLPTPKYCPPVKLKFFTQSKDYSSRCARAIFVLGPNETIPTSSLCYLTDLLIKSTAFYLWTNDSQFFIYLSNDS